MKIITKIVGIQVNIRHVSHFMKFSLWPTTKVFNFFSVSTPPVLFLAWAWLGRCQIKNTFQIFSALLGVALILSNIAVSGY
jgi:hypothetical protein